MQSFDLIVVGTGTAGKTVAEAIRQTGKSVAIIDKAPFGGTCSQRGCDPKKVLVGAAELVDRTTRLLGKGIQEKAFINWQDLMRFKKTFTDSVPEQTVKKFAGEGLIQFHGAATFTSPNSIRVGDNEMQAKHIVLATGQRPKPLNIPGEEWLTDSTGFLELEQLPKKIVMIGGGYIAFEFAHIAACAGANVTILHQGKRPLEQFDADVVNLLVKAMEATGIQIILNAKVTAIEGEAGELTVTYSREEVSHALSAELVVHAAGRIADVAELDLEKAGVQVNEKGIAVNEHLQSISNPAVYACGDVADKGLPLTSLTSYEGRIVAQNILKGNHQQYVDAPVPSAVFTIPTLVSVGLTEEQANQQGYKVKVTFQETADWYTSRRINEPFSGFKTLVDEKTDQIVGAHLLGTGSEEIINLFTVAMKHKISAKDLSSTMFVYPTPASDLSSMLP